MKDPVRYTKDKKGSVGLYGASAQIKDATVFEELLNVIVDCFTALPPSTK
jgi:hypothetical protein